MSQPNPVFKNTDRSAYEFGYLIRSLPRHLHGESLTAEQLLEVEAADLHATNSSERLLRGLQALGRVMWSAGVNEQYPVDESNFADVGLLVTEIALQIQFLGDFHQSVMEQELRIANGKATK